MPPPISPVEREARRRELLESALRTFAATGFARSTTKAIAAGAGVAEGTIYLYFRSKDDLLLTAFRERVAEFAAEIETRAAEPLPFRERLGRLVEMQFDNVERDPALARLLLLEARQSAEFYTEPIREALHAYETALEALLRAGIEEGAVRPDIDVAVTRWMLVGALRGVLTNWLLGEREQRLTPLAAAFTATFIDGIGPDV